MIYKDKEDFLATEQLWFNFEELCKNVAFQESEASLNTLKKLVPEWEPSINHELKN